MATPKPNPKAKLKAIPAFFNIEDTDPYLDAEAGAWLHLEDRRDIPHQKLYADGDLQQKPVRLKLLGFLADSVQMKAADINKRTTALIQTKIDAAKAAGASEAEAKKAGMLTEDEAAGFDAELYAFCTIDSEHLGYRGQVKLSPELAQELYFKRADIRAQVREFMGKPANFKRMPVRH